MNITQGLQSLLAVFVVAALTPVLAAALPGPRIPQVVFFLIGGVVIGPHVLGVADTASVQLVADGGLGFLFLLAGYELDPMLLRQRPGRLAIGGWLMSVSLSLGTVAALSAAGFARNPLRLVTFFVLLLVIRGLPSLLVYRRALPLRQRAEMTFITATAMPLLVALAEIGLRDGKMLPANAAALVGAGVLSVLVFPAVAIALAKKDGQPVPAGAAELLPQARHPADDLLPWHR